MSSRRTILVTRLTLMPKIFALTALACSSFIARTSNCQAPAVQPVAIAYDAVTIKPDKSGSGSVHISVRDATFQAGNVSLKQLIVQAYGIRDNLIAGLPGWAESDHFDINAKVVDTDPKLLNGLPEEQRRAMLAAVLADRFKLKLHTEIKDLPVYDLVVVKGGAKIRQTAPAPPPNPIPDAAPHPGVGRGDFNSHGNGSSVELTAKAVPLARLVEYLTLRADRNVVDKTELVGEYDLHLLFAPDNAPLLNGQADPAAPPALFTALQEQLGLKLVPSRGPVPTLVVDHAEPPSEN